MQKRKARKMMLPLRKETLRTLSAPEIEAALVWGDGSPTDSLPCSTATQACSGCAGCDVTKV
jgi:hypothetical protein